jgi:hypothetical protein
VSGVWPSAGASRDEIAALLKEHAPAPEPEHEAPLVENGPSPVCNACGVVRVSLLSPFCKGCLREIGGAL